MQAIANSCKEPLKAGAETTTQALIDLISSSPLEKRRKGNQGSKSKFYYKSLVCAFDIETSRIIEIEQSIMYIWQLQIGESMTIIGRTWEEFQVTIDAICCALQDDEWLVIYVHNLSYEFQFLRSVYDFQSREVFAMDHHKVAKCTMFDKLELRCSYIHSNMSLSAFLQQHKVSHQKLSGDAFDYSKVRYPWTELTDLEMEYAVNDVLGLVEAIRHEMDMDGDNLYTIPLTNTGYVRRDAKRAMREIPRGYVKNQLPDWQTYLMCREAFRGGNTHANRYHVGLVIEDVSGWDRSSSYPEVMNNREYPVSPFQRVESEEQRTLEYISDLMNRRHKALLMRVALSNVRLRDDSWGFPYLSRDKCRHIIGGLYDNGRILKADYLETTITDIDLQIIQEEFLFDDFVCYDLAFSRYGLLPKQFRDTTIEYYRGKTELKGVPATPEFNAPYFYVKSKNKLNSLYGMTATDPVRLSIIYRDGQFLEDETQDPEETLELSNKRAFLAYQWGVWTTAWSRWELEAGLRLCHDSDNATPIYCDTDSVYYSGTVDWGPYNRNKVKLSTAHGAYATDPYGVTHYMGVYECDGVYEKFKTLGAKKYVTVKNGKLKITIAGVNKVKGAAELGRIEEFREGFVFRDAGGNELVYNDSDFGWYEVDGHRIYIGANVVIRESTYTLGITEEYRRLLSDPKYFSFLLQFQHKYDNLISNPDN